MTTATKPRPKTKAEAGVPDLDGFDTTEQVFDAVNDLIWSTCHAFTRCHGGDVEEHYAESCFWFINRTIPTFDPNSNRSFSSWTRMRVFNHLLDLHRTSAQRNARLPRTAEEEIYVEEDRHHFDLGEFKRSMSRKAAIVVHMLTSGKTLDGVPRVEGYGIGNRRCDAPNSLEVKKAIARELVLTWKWTAKEVLGAFNEIKHALE